MVNVNVDIKEEDNTLILLNSLPDEEYETFILTLIIRKQSLNYNDMSVALVNYEVRRKDKQFSSSSRGRGSNQKDKGVRGRSNSKPRFKDLKKNQCAFYKELEH